MSLVIQRKIAGCGKHVSVLEPAFALLILAFVSCAGPKKVVKVIVDGKPASLLLWLDLPPSITNNAWQNDVYKELIEECREDGFDPVVPAPYGPSSREIEQSSFAGCTGKNCALDAARFAKANLVLFKKWHKTAQGCSYGVRVIEIESEQLLVEEVGEARRGCTERGLSRPIAVAAKTAIQQASYMLKRRQAMAVPLQQDQEASSKDERRGESFASFKEAMDRLADSLGACGCEKGSSSMESSIEISVEVSENGEVQIDTDAGAGVSDSVVNCIEGKTRTWTFPLPAKGETFSTTVSLHLKEHSP